ncbi:hypothetical protein [Arachidicoccus terrestris]|uniref:hypothetical protein n=1 Tax=Arachidicoccus terrestris TaxID=2875539 RepID=UPI001CC350C7|nr:hypothetical protein [Arachidicoccus terrestris]UAY56255.1 hypothetical protein K9M52_04345 [Arachidicoccus terrestris]
MARPRQERVSQREYATRIGVSNEAVRKAIKEGKIKRGWDSKEKKIIVQAANAEWGKIHMQNNVEKLIQNNTRKTESPQGSSGPVEINKNSSYADIRRGTELLKFQASLLDLKKRKGELVDRVEVHKQLFVYGQQVRTALLAIPDRHIDAILAAKSRQEAYGILSAALYDILEDLTKKEIDFTPRDGDS